MLSPDAEDLSGRRARARRDRCHASRATAHHPRLACQVDRGWPAEIPDRRRVAASNSIEGFEVSTTDVADLIEGEHDVEVSDENLAETVAYQRIMTYIQTLHDAPISAQQRAPQRTPLDVAGPPAQPAQTGRTVAAGRSTSLMPATRQSRRTRPSRRRRPRLTEELIDWLNAPTKSLPLSGRPWLICIWCRSTHGPMATGGCHVRYRPS